MKLRWVEDRRAPYIPEYLSASHYFGYSYDPLDRLAVVDVCAPDFRPESGESCFVKFIHWKTRGLRPRWFRSEEDAKAYVETEIAKQALEGKI